VDQFEQLGPLALGFDTVSIEVFAQSNIGIQAGRVFVEVEESGRLPIENAPILLHQSFNVSDLNEKWLQLVECSFSGVFHLNQLMGCCPHALIMM
jgi:hypothetical protein